MPKILRKDQKIFAGSVLPTNVVAQFGSLSAGAKQYSSDLDVIQALPIWGSGWINALVNGSAPALQDRNAVDYVTTYQLAYLMEQGIPDYSATQNYFVGSYCKDETTGVMHVSKTNDNQNNALNDSTNWEPVSSAGRGSVPIGSIIAVVPDYANVSIPSSGSISVDGFQLCDGAPVNADAVIGVGTELGTDMPDLTDGRFLRGSNASGTIGGSATKTLLVDNLPSHDHAIDHNHPSATTNSAGNHSHFAVYQGTASASGSLQSGETVKDVRTTSEVNSITGDPNLSYQFTGNSSTANRGKTNTAGSHSHTLDLGCKTCMASLKISEGSFQVILKFMPE